MVKAFERGNYPPRLANCAHAYIPGVSVSSTPSREIASLFLGEKAFYDSMDRTGASREVVGTGSPLTDNPLVVLVNEATASAAEILAGALKDNHRAVLVGSKTFGQGIVHSLRTLSDDAGLVVAIAHLTTPAGREAHRKGIEPDLPVETPGQLLTPSEVAASKDLQYEKAVKTLLQHIHSRRSFGSSAACSLTCLLLITSVLLSQIISLCLPLIFPCTASG